MTHRDERACVANGFLARTHSAHNFHMSLREYGDRVSVSKRENPRAYKPLLPRGWCEKKRNNIYIRLHLLAVTFDTEVFRDNYLGSISSY